MGNAISPQHYQQHPSGVECIAVTRDQITTIGSCIKYLWRAGLKGSRVEDLQKAMRYLAWAVEGGARINSTPAVDAFLGWRMFGEDDDGRDEDRVIDWVLREELHEALADLEDLIAEAQS